jgi:hypothetical protein
MTFTPRVSLWLFQYSCRCFGFSHFFVIVQEIAKAGPKSVAVLFDKQASRSRELAAEVRWRFRVRRRTENYSFRRYCERRNTYLVFWRQGLDKNG